MEIKEALIVVDMQNDFCPGGALPVTEGDQVVIPASALIASAQNREDILPTASFDWHPKDTNHFDEWPIHCVQFTRGAQNHPGLNLSLRNVRILLKGTKKDEPGYSAAKAFIDLLEELGITTITKVRIAGLALDYCIKATAIDLAKAGFETYVILDATKAVSLKTGNDALEEMENAGVKFIKTLDLLIEWNTKEL